VAALCVPACRKATPEAAWRAYREKRFDEAIRDWSTILNQSPKSGEALYGLGLAYLAEGNTAAAEGRIARSLDLLEGRPEQRPAYVHLCDLYLERHRSERRYMDAFWQMTRYMGQRFRADFDFARINASGCEVEAVLASSRSDLHSAEAWWAKAVELWEWAATMNPNDARVFSGLGRSCQATGDLAKADQSWRRLLRVDPGSAEAHLGLVSVALSRANPADLSAAVRSVVSARPDDAKLLTTIAERLVSQRHPEEYKLVAARLEQLARENKLEWLALGQLYERARMPNEALRSYQEGAGSNSRTAIPCLKSETRILLNEHRNHEAQEGLNALKTKHVQDAETEMLEALFLLNQGLTEEAISRLVRISSTDRDRNMVLALARAYVKHEDYTQAVNLLQTWDHQNPNDVEILSVLSEAQSKMGDRAAAAYTANQADQVRKGQPGQ
jgi:tetratricopeptide (TPR) repeat protein